MCVVPVHTVNIIAFFIGYHGDAKAAPPLPTEPPPIPTCACAEERGVAYQKLFYARQPSILLKEDERFQAASGSGTGRQLL